MAVFCGMAGAWLQIWMLLGEVLCRIAFTRRVRRIATATPVSGSPGSLRPCPCRYTKHCADARGLHFSLKFFLPCGACVYAMPRPPVDASRVFVRESFIYASWVHYFGKDRRGAQFEDVQTCFYVSSRTFKLVFTSTSSYFVLS